MSDDKRNAGANNLPPPAAREACWPSRMWYIELLDFAEATELAKLDNGELSAKKLANPPRAVTAEPRTLHAKSRQHVLYCTILTGQILGRWASFPTATFGVASTSGAPLLRRRWRRWRCACAVAAAGHLSEWHGGGAAAVQRRRRRRDSRRRARRLRPHRPAHLQSPTSREAHDRSRRHADARQAGALEPRHQDVEPWLAESWTRSDRRPALHA